MADSNAVATVSVVGSQNLVAQLPIKEITREMADLTSPGGSKPMRRSYIHQTTPPAEFFGHQRAQLIHTENLLKRAACDAEFADARVNKVKYDSRRRSRKRAEKNKVETGFARRKCESKAARAERGAPPRKRKMLGNSPLPTAQICEDISDMPNLQRYVAIELDRIVDGQLPFNIAAACEPHDTCFENVDEA